MQIEKPVKVEKELYMKTISSKLIERVKELLNQRNEKPSPVFTRIGIGDDFFRNATNSIPQVTKIFILADHFGVSTDYLLGRTDSMAAPARSEEDPTLATLLGYYDRFSQEGREKLVTYAADLQEKYTKAPALISLKAAARDGGVKPVPAEAADAATKKMVTSSDETL